MCEDVTAGWGIGLGSVGRMDTTVDGRELEVMAAAAAAVLVVAQAKQTFGVDAPAFHSPAALIC